MIPSFYDDWYLSFYYGISIKIRFSFLCYIDIDDIILHLGWGVVDTTTPAPLGVWGVVLPLP